ncbi:hypothetical protein Rsub_00088 [Raphidocelis subcapitata]|uniref:Protein kinase domain-containing protein n=1 Tax=Raphidocelis subcapitata TaxID=307507 RepID=A0A2V0NR16_9CHLO|nr:hypothetical protein Rsub_00088 [Raphidocelis subcapitata]|eukprot:GBF87377.1 hypothetical protein Rsub_00088 [Raphidocelis subcapitata]
MGACSSAPQAGECAQPQRQSLTRASDAWHGLQAPQQAASQQRRGGSGLEQHDPPKPKTALQDEQRLQQEQRKQQQHGQAGHQQREARGSADSFNMHTVRKVQRMQQQLALVSGAPALGLLEAVELLTRELDVDLACIVGFPPAAPPNGSSDPGAAGASGPIAGADGARPAVLLSAHGVGAPVVEQCCVMHGGGWSYARLAKQAAEAAAAADAAAEEGDETASSSDGAVSAACILTSAGSGSSGGASAPRDWRALRTETSLRSFALVLIGPADAPLGALAIARQDRHSFDNLEWWTLWLQSAGTGLLHILNSWQVGFICRLLLRLDRLREDEVQFISCLLQGARTFIMRTANASMRVRLALLDAADRSKALVFTDRPDQRGGQKGSASAALPAPDPSEGAVATAINLAGTLLESALAMGKARFVRDITTYLQMSSLPARDLFLTSGDTVASLVIVPLVARDLAFGFGAFYYSLATPCDFENLQECLMGFTSAVTLITHSTLAGRTRALWAHVEAARAHSVRLSAGAGPQHLSQPNTPTPDDGGNTPRGAHALIHFLDEEVEFNSGAADAGGSSAAAAAQGASHTGTGTGSVPLLFGHAAEGSDFGAADSCQLSTVSSRRLCTEAMVEVVQSEIHRNRARSASFTTGTSLVDLVLEKVLGSGGYGTVYRGSWKKITAAIKVFYARSSERDAVKDAVEMAVLSCVHHPNIVSLYTCITDCIETADKDSAGTTSSSGPATLGGSGHVLRPRYRRLLPGEDHEGAICSIVVMEYCDAGTLRGALRRGVFHRCLPGGEVGVDLAAVLEVLIEVAAAIQYCHSLQLVHCDIKAENVLLKSDRSRRLGFTPKLADFGLAKLITGGYITNRSGAGTCTHLAPEMLVAGARITAAVDAFSFGILMYEAYSGSTPYRGLARDAIISAVRDGHLRPAFPRGTPSRFSALAAACWAHDPAKRPGFGAVADALSAMRGEVEAALPSGPAVLAPHGTAAATMAAAAAASAATAAAAAGRVPVLGRGAAALATAPAARQPAAHPPAAAPHTLGQAGAPQAAAAAAAASSTSTPTAAAPPAAAPPTAGPAERAGSQGGTGPGGRIGSADSAPSDAPSLCDMLASGP